MNNKHLSWNKEINNNFIIASRAYFLHTHGQPCQAFLFDRETNKNKHENIHRTQHTDYNSTIIQQRMNALRTKRNNSTWDTYFYPHIGDEPTDWSSHYLTEVMQRTCLARALREDEDWANLHLHHPTLLWVGVWLLGVWLKLIRANAAGGSVKEPCRG